MHGYQHSEDSTRSNTKIYVIGGHIYSRTVSHDYEQNRYYHYYIFSKTLIFLESIHVYTQI